MPQSLATIPEIVVGNIVSGKVVFRDVVITPSVETATPYKPPTPGGIRPIQPKPIKQIDESLDTSKFLKMADDTYVILIAQDGGVIAASPKEAPDLIAEGNYFIGAYDKVAAEAVIKDLVENPIETLAEKQDRYARDMQKLLTSGYLSGLVLTNAMIDAQEGWSNYQGFDDFENAALTTPITNEIPKPAQQSQYPVDYTITFEDVSQSSVDNVLRSGVRQVSGRIGVGLGGGATTATEEGIKTYLLVQRGVSVGGDMTSHFSTPGRDSSNSSSWVETRWPTEPRDAEETARSLGMQILGIAYSRKGSPQINEVFSRANAWNSSNPSRKVTTSTFGFTYAVQTGASSTRSGQYLVAVPSNQAERAMLQGVLDANKSNPDGYMLAERGKNFIDVIIPQSSPEMVVATSPAIQPLPVQQQADLINKLNDLQNQQEILISAGQENSIKYQIVNQQIAQVEQSAGVPAGCQPIVPNPVPPKLVPQICSKPQPPQPKPIVRPKPKPPRPAPSPGPTPPGSGSGTGNPTPK